MSSIPASKFVFKALLALGAVAHQEAVLLHQIPGSHLDGGTEGPPGSGNATPEQYRQEGGRGHVGEDKTLHQQQANEIRFGNGRKAEDLLRIETEEDTHEARRLPTPDVRSRVSSALHHEAPELQAVRMGPGEEDLHLFGSATQQRAVYRFCVEPVQRCLRRLQVSCCCHYASSSTASISGSR